ncbi:MAG: amino acid ABC transporter substrate-binding protein [Pseudanabaena sp.]|nr:MAG: amino acid ABC transporter substrate-binding protein [Pseudanabaena sp.]
MLKKLAIAALSLACVTAIPATAFAETVMEKVSRTGELTVGSSLDLVPYSYFNDKKEWVGYSVDILNILKTQIEKEIGKPITISVIPGGYGADRIPQMINNEIDIACEAQFTWERDQYVDFSLSYGISGIKLLSPTSKKFDSAESLVGKRVGVLENSIGSQVMKRTQPRATLVTFKSPEAGLELLKSGKVDAVAGDAIIMMGLKEKLKLDDYQITPDEPFARYGMACMVPENNPAFLRLVDRSIMTLMQGYVIGDKKSVEMISQWFGPKGIIKEVSSEEVKAFFQFMIMTREQIPLTKS